MKSRQCVERIKEVHGSRPCPVDAMHFCAEDGRWRCTRHMEAFRGINTSRPGTWNVLRNKYRPIQGEPPRDAA